MKTNPTTDQLNRGEFLRSLGMSSAALMAFYCMGTSLTACSNSESDPTPTPTPTGNGLTGNADASAGAVNFTIDLTNSTYSSLKTVGNFVKIGSVIVANAKGNKYVSIERLCTHLKQDAILYRVAEDDFYCSPDAGGHRSKFATNGSVQFAAGGINQPAMKSYTTSLSADGNSLTVKA